SDLGGMAYSLVWSNASLGTHYFYAKFVQAGGIVTTNYSNTNTLSVVPVHDISFDWIAPTNLETFAASGSIQLLAGLRDTNGQIALAEFFDGTHSIGYASNGVVLDPPFPPGWVEG